MDKEISMGVLAKKLTRTDLSDAYFSGVCGGIAAYTGVDSTVVRVSLAVLTVITGVFPAALAYGVAWFLMPSEKYDPVGF